MPRDAITQALRSIEPAATFAARLSVPVSALELSVAEVGPVGLPLAATTTKKLIARADKAPYGRRDQTLIDLRVRDTWQIPGAKLTARWDQAAWRGALARIAETLGFGSGDVLEARLQDMLLYERGQFFAAHQDSEKDDEMLGTLVVVLPPRTPFTGGASVVRHLGKRKTLRAKQAPTEIELFGFFADCRHEVQPVKSGHRVVLTYRLHRRRDAAPDLERPASEAPAPLLDAVRSYFETPLPLRHEWDRSEPPPPRRLLYLLDHEYTPRGLAAKNLKPLDAARVRALSAVAAALECEAVLALVDVHEQWLCEDDYRGYRRGRRYEYVDEDDEEDLPSEDHPELIDLIDWDLELHQLTALHTGKVEDVCGDVDPREVCHTLATHDLTPHHFEHQGYMGNWGNTVDRWYHRAAIVLWPRKLSFMIRAESSAGWALDHLRAKLATEGAEVARERTARVLEDWPRTAREETSARFFTDTLRLAAGLEAPELAAGLLAPFELVRITPGAAPALASLRDTYGAPWLLEVLAGWRREFTRLRSPDPVGQLSQVCARLRDHSAADVARWLLMSEQGSFQSTVQFALETPHLFGDVDELERHAPRLLDVLDAALTLEAFEVTDAILESLLHAEDPPSTTALVALLRAAAARYPDPDLALLGLAPVYGACVDRLTASVAAGPRASDDWSLPPPPPRAARVHWLDDERVTKTLRAFLVASDQRHLEWPLKKEGRQLVHRILDEYDFPVTHVTRRSGRPFLLVLDKTEEVHTRAAAARARAEADLAWLHRLEPRLMP